jgi:type I restriction enzyme S subunit
MTGSAGQLRVPKEFIMDTEVPVPSLNEQRIIVNEVERLLSKIDSGIDELMQAEQKIERYRGVVIQKAINGELTEDWRDSNHTNLDLEEFSSPDLSGQSKIPELPPSWEWVEFGSLLRERLRNGYSAKETDEGIRTLTLGAITNREFSEEYTKITEIDPEKAEDLWLESGDVLIERSNGTTEYVGLPAVYRGEENWAIHSDLMIRARVKENRVIPEFVDYMLLSPFLRNYLMEKSKGSSTMSKINQKHLRNMPFPLAPMNEQREIVRQLEHIISILNETRQSVEVEIERGGSLRQSVIKSAFKGELAGSRNMEQQTGSDTQQATIHQVIDNVE